MLDGLWKSFEFSTIFRKRPCPRPPGDADLQRKRKPLPPCARRLLRFPKRNKFLFAKPDSLAAVVAPEKTEKHRVPFFWRSGIALLGSCGVAFVRSLPIIQYFVPRRAKKQVVNTAIALNSRNLFHVYYISNSKDSCQQYRYSFHTLYIIPLLSLVFSPMITEILQLLQLQDLTFLHRTRYRTKHLFWIAAANTFLRGNG